MAENSKGTAKGTPLMKLLLKLCRSNMTVVSAVTHLCGALLAPTRFHIGRYFLGYAFVVMTQLQTHVLGEYYDFSSDRLNKYSGRLTGGSKALVNRDVDRSIALKVGWGLAIFSALIILALPAEVKFLGVWMLVLANQYSAPPLSFNHRALGEIIAATVTNILLPIFAYKVQMSAHEPVPVESYWANLKYLIVAPAILKVALFLVLNMNDRRADWQGFKITLAVILNDLGSSRLHLILLCAAYIAPFIITNYRDFGDIRCLLLLEITLPLGIAVSRYLFEKWHYRFEKAVVLSFIHAPLPVFLLLINALVENIVKHGFVNSILPLMLTGLYLYLQGVPVTQLMKSSKDFEEKKEEEVRWRSDDQKIIICGASICGLALAAFLEHLSVPYILLEERTEEEVRKGSTFAFWPPAITALKEVGVPSAFWSSESVSIKEIQVVEGFSKVTSVNIDQVVDGPADELVVVARNAMIAKLQELVPRSKVLYSAEVTRMNVDIDNVVVTVKHGEDQTTQKEILGRVIIGADGMHSITRKHIFPTLNLHYRHELIHRGELDLSEDDMGDVKETVEVKSEKEIMMIKHKHGLEYSVGYLNREHTQAYWYVRQSSFLPAEQLNKETFDKCISAWPKSMRTLFERTDPSRRFTYSVEDARHLRRQSKERVALVGDAAHPVTANMMEGASLAVIDALTMAVYLREYITYADGHVEAFYRYQRRRDAEVRTAIQHAKAGMYPAPRNLPVTVVRIMPELPKSVVLERNFRTTKISKIKDLLASLRDYHSEKRPLLAV